MSSQSLLNAVAFAKACGVSTQTVLNWVKDGRVKPAKTVENKSWFSEENVAQVKIMKAKACANKSFLGVICNQSEDECKVAESAFIEKMQTSFPDLKEIPSLIEWVTGIDFSSENSAMSVVTMSIIDELHASFVVDLQNVVNSTVFRICSPSDKFNASLTLGVCLNMAFGKSLSEEEEALVTSVFGSGVETTKNMLKTSCAMAYNETAIQWGLFGIITDVGLSIEDAYFGNIKSISSRVDIALEIKNKKARALYEHAKTKVKGQLINSSINTICSKGYFSVKSFCSDNETKNENEKFVINAILSNEYKTIYVSDQSNIPIGVASILEAVSERGDVIVVTSLDDLK